jgi:nicotinamide-nucleotide adenylyltransferase
MANSKNEELVAILGRWQPIHLGHQAALHSLCDQFKQVVIGIGSSNIEDYRNPFTLTEVVDMLNLSLGGYSNFESVPIPDVLDDVAWCEQLGQSIGQLTQFVTANPFVKSLLSDRFTISHPSEFIPDDRKVAISGTMVRREMARGDAWQSLVPAEIANYIIGKQLDSRFRAAYGLQTIAMETIIV